MSEQGLMLRFRDLVTEPGGNIIEHRNIIDALGFTWWGWWARSYELIPSAELSDLSKDGKDFPIVLFDSGLLQFYFCRCSKIAVAPSKGGISSPYFRATPDYYVRGSYPAWFRLHGTLNTVDKDSFEVVASPTLSQRRLPYHTGPLDIGELRDDRPTLWLINMLGAKR